MKIRVILTAVALLVALVATGGAHAQRAGRTLPQGDPNTPVVERGGFGPTEAEIVEFRDGIYLIRSAGSGNITVFTSDNGLLLVDSKLPNEYDRIMELLRTVTDQPILYLINTHHHGDHTGGNASLEDLGARIIATDNARKRLSRSQNTGLPVLTFADHLNVYFAGRTLQLYYYGRGHTDGDLVIYIPEEKILMAGDLFAGWGPSIRLIDYDGGGSFVQWPATLEQVMQLDFDTVIPGHSGVTDRAHMQAYLDENRRMLDLVRMMKAAGKAPVEISSALQMEFGNMAFLAFPDVQSVLDEVR